MPTLSIYNKCNNNCVICTNPDKFWQMKKKFSLSHLLGRINRFYKGEKEFVDNNVASFSISGGEPTLSPHLVAVVKKINILSPKTKIICLSNGRMFSYVDYTKNFLGTCENLELIISVHGHNSKIHDKITRNPGSFSQTQKGIENILRFKKITQSLEIRVVIHRLNYRFLVEIIKFIKSYFPGTTRLVLVFFEIEGQAVKNLQRIKLTYSQLLPYLDKVYSFIKVFPEVRFYHFPLCVVPPKFYPYVWRTLPRYEVNFLKNCRSCSIKEFCLGIHNGYLKYIGEREFRPKSNNFKIIKNTDWFQPIKQIINS